MNIIKRVLRTCLSRNIAPHSCAVNPYAYCDLPRDEYVVWLRHILGGYLDAGNVAAFEYCLREMPPDGAIIEVGSFLGLSTNVLAYAAQKYNRINPFFCCDPWNHAGYGKTFSQYFNNGVPAYREWAKQIFKMNLSLFSKDIMPYSIELMSDSFFEKWQTCEQVVDLFGRTVTLGGGIAFAYIDGDHGYEGVKKDFQNLDQHLVSGGLVLLDDSADNSAFPGVRRLAKEVSADNRYEKVFKCPNYCFRKR